MRGAQEESGSLTSASTMLCLAFEMLRAVSKVVDPLTKRPIEMRIGVHTGAITGGVIGTMTLRYDIWGKDVLAANLMEAHGEPCRIKVSESTASLLRCFPDLELDPSDTVEVRARACVDSESASALPCMCVRLHRFGVCL